MSAPQFREIHQISPFPDVTKNNYQKIHKLTIGIAGVLGIIGISLIVLGNMDIIGLNALSGSAIGGSVCIVGIAVGLVGKRKLDEIYSKLKVNQQFLIMDTIAMNQVTKGKRLHAVFNHAKKDENRKTECEFRFYNPFGSDYVKVIRYNPRDFPDVKNYKDDNLVKYELQVLNAWRASTSTIEIQPANEAACFHSFQEDYGDVITETAKLYETRRTHDYIIQDLKALEAYEAGR